jgi:hypothetical protein
MSAAPERLTAALADRYRIERKLGACGAGRAGRPGRVAVTGNPSGDGTR